MVNTVTATSTGIRIDQEELAPLRRQLAGNLLMPGDAGYDDARTLWNGMIDKRPGLIVQAQDEVDVQRAVLFAAQRGLPLSVKGGGHNVAGHALSEGGVTIDLSSMREVRVDPVALRAFVQGGALWRDVDAATAEHGLATTGGVISSTGVGGLTLGGGIGWLVGRHGMSIDNLRSATVVTASETSHPDLFWAIRGGGGNFGVVTSFEFALYPVADVLAGYMVFPAEETRQVLERYRELTESGPDDLGCYAEVATDAESGARMIALAYFWPGDPEEGRRLLAPLRTYGTVLAEVMEVMPYAMWQQAWDEEFPHGRHYYWKGALMERIDDGVIDALVEHAVEAPLPGCMMAIEWYRGAMNQVAPEATAFASRAAQYQVLAIGGWEAPGEQEQGIYWSRRVYGAIAPHALNGAFLNFNSAEPEEKATLARRGFGPNWDRLVGIKRRYDPTNLFRGNHNIPPE